MCSYLAVTRDAKSDCRACVDCGFRGFTLRAIAAYLCAASVSAAAHGANPSDIWVYEMAGAPIDQRITMSTLMGNVNKTNPEMYMAYQGSSASSNPKIWLERYVATQPATQVHWNSNAQFFVDKYAAQLNGYVLYDNAGTKRNEATSLAGVLGAIAVNPATLGLATSAGLPLLEDVTTRDTAWLVANYGSQFNKDKVFSLDLFHGHELRDYAVLHNGLMYWDPPDKDTILAGQNDHTLVYGWDAGEAEFFASASANNLKAAAANFSQGYSALSQWDVNIPEQSTHTPASTPTDANKHYVAFVMSDGDNAQWLTNGFADDPQWFGSPHRGNFTMNWDIMTSMQDLAPIVVKHLYENASTGATKDYFVTAHGVGTDYPSEVPDYVGSMAANSASMATMDQNVLSILDTSWDTSKFDIMLSDPTVMGGMFKSNWGCAYACMGGAIHWSNGKPMVSAKYSLWDGFGSAASISGALNALPRDPVNNQASYSVVNVHPWSTGGLGDAMSNVNDLVSQLDANVEVVTMEELMIHLRRNFGTLVPPGDFDLNGIVDGADFLKWQRGQSPNPLSSVDLADWEANYGMVATPVATSAAVPEPTALLLACVAALMLPRRLRV